MRRGSCLSLALMLSFATSDPPLSFDGGGRCPAGLCYRPRARRFPLSHSYNTVIPETSSPKLREPHWPKDFSWSREETDRSECLQVSTDSYWCQKSDTVWLDWRLASDPAVIAAEKSWTCMAIESESRLCLRASFPLSKTIRLEQRPLEPAADRCISRPQTALPRAKDTNVRQFMCAKHAQAPPSSPLPVPKKCVLGETKPCLCDSHPVPLALATPSPSSHRSPAPAIVLGTRVCVEHARDEGTKSRAKSNPHWARCECNARASQGSAYRVDIYGREFYFSAVDLVLGFAALLGTLGCVAAQVARQFLSRQKGKDTLPHRYERVHTRAPSLQTLRGRGPARHRSGERSPSGTMDDDSGRHRRVPRRSVRFQGYDQVPMPPPCD